MSTADPDDRDRAVAWLNEHEEDNGFDRVASLTRLLRSYREEGLRRAMGHAYVAQMAEGAEDIVRQELERERKDHAATRRSRWRLEEALYRIERTSLDPVTREAAHHALNVDD